MGERTQLMIKLNDKQGTTKFSTVLHYQWGYGRSMLMDALNLVAQFPFYYELKLDKPFGDGYEKAYYNWLGKKSVGINYEGDVNNLDQDQQKYAFHADEDYLWNCDNDDGFMVLNFFEGSHGSFDKCTATFFAYDLRKPFLALKQMSFEDYCKASDNNKYTTDEFRQGWKLLAENYGIKLHFPKVVNA